MNHRLLFGNSVTTFQNTKTKVKEKVDVQKEVDSRV